jgi:hypothetical protein
MKLNRIALGLTAIALMLLMVSTASACYMPPGLSPGYWKHNVNVYCGGNGSYSGDPHETAETMEGYAAYILTGSLGYAPTHDQIVLFLSNVNGIFHDNTQKDMWLTIANWFNAAAGRLPYSD